MKRKKKFLEWGEQRKFFVKIAEKGKKKITVIILAILKEVKRHISKQEIRKKTSTKLENKPTGKENNNS